MAVITFGQREPQPLVFTLELTEAEALYVYAALRFAMPARAEAAPEGGDPVWGALGGVLDASGVGRFGDGGEYAVRD